MKTQYCKTCEQPLKKCTCSSPDIIDEALAIGLGIALVEGVESFLDEDNSSPDTFSSDDSISSSDDNSSPDFGGGDFGGGGSGGDF